MTRALVVAWWLAVGGGIAGTLMQPLQAADVDKGKVVFEQCAACHSLGEAGDFDGPTLKGVIGRKAGSLEDYRYSAAMKRSDVTWNETSLDMYVADPQALIPGNRMAFAGIGDRTQRDDLLAYIAVAARDTK